MSRIAYVNGSFVPHDEAYVHIEDRGYQFADGVYEYIAFFNQIALDLDPHLERLERSLSELRIRPPVKMRVLKLLIDELIEQNLRPHGGIYLQVSRGVASRDHPFPANDTPSSLVMTVAKPKTPPAALIEKGAKVITRPDQRWARCDIKSIALLPNVLAKQAATAAGAREAWLTKENGIITEGAVSNAYIIKDGTLQTHPATHDVLPGITRAVALQLARENDIPVKEEAFTVDEAASADEAFLTSTTSNILPIVKMDEHTIGSGAPGEVTRKLLQLYHNHIHYQTGMRLT